MQDSHRHQADRQNTTGTRELWALPTIRDLSASKAVMQTAIGGIIAAWKGRANTFRTEKGELKVSGMNGGYLGCISIFSWNSGDIYEQAFVKTFVGFFTGIPNIHLARCALRPDLCYAPTSSIKNLRLLALISGSWHWLFTIDYWLLLCVLGALCGRYENAVSWRFFENSPAILYNGSYNT